MSRSPSPMELAMRNGVVAPSKLGKWSPPRKEMPIGPAGLHIPSETAVYRPTIDEGLLNRICARAFGDWAASELPDSWRAEVVEAITTDIDRRFPEADMAVLKRHGFTTPVDKIHVSVEGGRIFYHRPLAFEMDDERDLPHRGAWYVAALGKPNAGGDADVPESTLSYFSKWDEVLFAERDQFRAAGRWPSTFKARNRRWPMWLEIEREWPRLAAWLAGQREALNA